MTLSRNHREIPLTQGKVAIVDECDFARLSLFKWQAEQRASGLWYATRREHITRRKGHKIYMHRAIMDAKKSEEIDHCDGNGLHNWRRNLRKVTHHLNTHNRQHAKGAYFMKGANRWTASITLNGKSIYLGCFKTEAEARNAYLKGKIERGLIPNLSEADLRREVEEFCRAA